MGYWDLILHRFTQLFWALHFFQFLSDSRHPYLLIKLIIIVIMIMIIIAIIILLLLT